MLLDKKPIILRDDVDKNKQHFTINTFAAFIECVSVIATHVKSKHRCHVTILNDDQRKLKEVREAYFAWLTELESSADSVGKTKNQLHEQFKADYLLPILTEKDPAFADMVIEVANKGDIKLTRRLLSLSDGNQFMTHKIMGDYFKASKAGWDNRFSESLDA